VISQPKTKAMVVGQSEPPATLALGGCEFECVREFRYLGMTIDERASLATMVQAMANRARQALGALCEFVGTQQWRVPWTRLVLLDVFVRTLLTYGASVWAPHYLGDLDDSRTRSPLGELAGIYRRGLKTLLGAPHDTRMEVLYILSLRWPVSLALAKATWRYYDRVRRLLGEGKQAPIVQLARWARIQDPGVYTL